MKLRVQETATNLILTGDPKVLDLLSDHFKVRPENYWRSPLWQLYKRSKGKAGWDSYIHLLKRPSKIQGILGRGHLSDFLEYAYQLDLELDLTGLIPKPFPNLVPEDLAQNLIKADFPPYPHQLKAVYLWLTAGIGINEITVSGGKCLGKDTPIIMFDGTTKMVQDVKVGDLLMGPDSTPRKVLSTISKIDDLFRVDQSYGESYVTNRDHILVLQSHGDCRNSHHGQVKEMSVDDFLKLPTSFRQTWQGIKSQRIEFEAQKLPCDPYWIGLWLGDGYIYGPSIAIGDLDAEILAYCQKYAEQLKLSPRITSGTGCIGFTFSRPVGSRQWYANQLTMALRSLGLSKDVNPTSVRFIPDIVKRNEKSVRLAVLAGLIDSDGHVAEKSRNQSISICTKHRRLGEDIVWISRSLGFRATLTSKIKKIKRIGFQGLYYTVHLNGIGIEEIPTKLLRKKIRPPSTFHKKCKIGTRSILRISSIGPGRYYGFELDGDRKFLLGDFTVTHNTATFCMAFAAVKRKISNSRCLYLVPTERLIRQAIKDARAFLPDWHITQYGGGSDDHSGKDLVIGTFAMVHANFAHLKNHAWFRTFTALGIDECHKSGSASVTAIIQAIPAYFKFGATDSVRAEADQVRWLKIRGLLGPVLSQTEAGGLIAAGNLAKPTIYMVDNKEWQGRFDDLSHVPNTNTPAWVYLNSTWKKGTYLGPAVERDAEGLPRVDRKGDMIQLPSAHRIDIDGLHLDVDSRWCLLKRTYDTAIIRFKERNQLIVDWGVHFAKAQERVLVVCTRYLHILLLQAKFQAIYDPGLVRILTGEASSQERDETFEWIRQTPGAILISSLVKEGVSIHELSAGVIADYVGTVDVANQIIGRFLRKKFHREDNTCKIVWFIDRQDKGLRQGSMNIFRELEQKRGYSFRHPVIGPETADQALLFEAP